MRVFDDLALYRGRDIKITDTIVGRQPTVDEITDIGEKDYIGMVQNFTATHLDESVIVFLHKADIDFTQITDFEVFLLLSRSFDKRLTQLIFPNLDFATMQLSQDDDGEIMLMDRNVIITKEIYYVLVEYVRKIHCLSKPQFTRIADDAKQKAMAIEAAEMAVNRAIRMAKLRPQGSVYLPLISAMVNSSGFKYNIDSVFDLKIFQFWDSVRRISAITNANHLYTGLYSGCLSTKGNSSIKKELDWMRALN